MPDIEPRDTDAHERLKAIVGPTGYLDDPRELESFLIDCRGIARGEATLLVKPSSTEQVAAIMTVCAEHGIAATPQGGNTSLCAGAVPTAGGIILSLARMNRIRAIGGSMTVEAGCILADLQQAAEANDSLFPLSLAAEGSCQIGGNLSTNAGGTQVLRYGTARAIVLGLEVVLPDGRVLSELGALHKDNRGYDLKQWFVGAEGTLGIITAATVKLYPAIRSRAVCLATLSSIEAALVLLGHARREIGPAISGFELLNRAGLDLVLKHVPNSTDPLDTNAEWMVLIDIGDTNATGDCAGQLETLLATAFEAGSVTDAAVASSEAQIRQLWHLRESISEAQRLEGASTKHDVSFAPADIPAFVHAATAAVAAADPHVRPVIFGHVGDGNLHFNINQPADGNGGAFLAGADRLTRIIYDVTAQFSGSFSAEHGIGLLKIDELARYRSPVALHLMRTMKQALDPRNLMNPGKILTPAAQAPAEASR